MIVCRMKHHCNPTFKWRLTSPIWPTFDKKVWHIFPSFAPALSLAEGFPSCLPSSRARSLEINVKTRCDYFIDGNEIQLCFNWGSRERNASKHNHGCDPKRGFPQRIPAWVLNIYTWSIIQRPNSSSHIYNIHTVREIRLAALTFFSISLEYEKFFLEFSTLILLETIHVYTISKIELSWTFSHFGFFQVFSIFFILEVRNKFNRTDSFGKNEQCSCHFSDLCRYNLPLWTF